MYAWEPMTVCIAAKTHTPQGARLVLCADMMGSNDLSSAETTWKIHKHSGDFYALIAGPIAVARELAGVCLRELNEAATLARFADVLVCVRNGIGEYKRLFADAHIKSRLGISYEEFQRHGSSSFPKDVYNEVSWEVKNHYSQTELIIAGYVGGAPMIVKVTADSAWECDDFAVIGSGTGIGEASLFQRSQSFSTSLDKSIYQVYEAKRLAEKAPSVGKNTMLFVVSPGEIQAMYAEGFQILEEYFQQFSPRPVAIGGNASAALVLVQKSDNIRN